MTFDSQFDDLFNSNAGALSFKFNEVGDSVQGTISELEVRQQTDFDTGNLKYWEDGKPQMEVVITLNTDERDPLIIDDDGKRRVFGRGAMLTALKNAVRNSGNRKPVKDGWMSVTLTGYGSARRADFLPPKLYAVEYRAPQDDTPPPERQDDTPPQRLSEVAPTQMNEVEAMFWEAHQTVPLIDGLVYQQRVSANGRSYRLDFAQPEAKFAIEVNGLEYHNGQESFIADHERRFDLEMAGWRVIAFAAKQVMDNPRSCVLKAYTYYASITGS